ncbi:uncharacterized protein LOC113092911, partial [Carassius auratus]|uniref:Uncharacterized protein LOC113092911 n=1 Tax=Carassius auratus TaxID=7957 RepID=A0A6P6P0D6_CARAU
VFGADEYEVKSMSVMEGDSVTLNPDPAQIQGFILILWRFGDPVIAQINGIEASYPRHTEIFIGRLQLDQTGLLKINNMRIKHSGLYKIEVIQRTGTSNMKFTVTVYESPSAVDAGVTEMKLMSVKEGDPVILQAGVPQLTGDELIVWKIQRQTEAGSDSGHYKVKISSNKQTIYQKYIVTVSEPGLSPAAVAVIVVVGIAVVVLLAAAAAAGLIYHRQTIAELPETVSGVEGEDVELKTGVTKLHTSDLIEWKGGNKDNLIAQIKEGTITSYEDVFYGVFRDRLKLDMKTGSLTIKNPRIEHTGPYKFLINEKCKKRFIVYIKETKTEIQTGDEIRWMFGDKDALIAEIKGETREVTTYYGPDGRFRDRLELDMANGSLTRESKESE